MLDFNEAVVEEAVSRYGNMYGYTKIRIRSAELPTQHSHVTQPLVSKFSLRPDAFKE